MNKKKPSFQENLLAMFLIALILAFLHPISKHYYTQRQINDIVNNFLQTLPAGLLTSEIHVMAAKFIVRFAIYFAFFFVILLAATLWQWANGDKKNGE